MFGARVIGFAAAGVVAVGMCRPATALDIVKDGKAAATIVLPDKADAVAQEAAKQIVENLRACTGETLPVVPQAQAPADGALISIGKTAAAEKLIPDADNQLADTYFLRVQGRTLFLLGRDDPDEKYKGNFESVARGTLCAAFAFLRDYAGVRWIIPGPYGVWDPKSRNISVPDDLNRKVEPILLYDGICGYYPWNVANCSRSAVRLAQADSHTWWYAFPNLDELRTQPDVQDREAKIKAAIEEFAKANPTVYAEIGGKRQNQPENMFRPGYNPMLCTSHPDFVTNMAKWERQQFDKGYDIVPLGESDGLRVCECAECMKRFGDPKTPLGRALRIYIPHMEVCKLCMESHPNKRVKLLVYAAPGAYLLDVASGREPNPGIRFPDNTLAELCVGGDVDLTHDSNQLRRVIPRLTHYVYWWTDYHSGLSAKQTPLTAALYMRTMLDVKSSGIYFCNGTGCNWPADGPSLYSAFRIIQDPLRNSDELLGEYCAGLYGKAAATMVQYYTLLYYRIRTLPGNDICYCVGVLFSDVPNDHVLGEKYLAFWPEANLKKMGALLKKAEDEAQGDARALNWIRLARVGYDHMDLTAAVYRAERAYEVNKNPETLGAIKGPMEAFNEFVKRVGDLQKTDPDFVRDCFPQYGPFAGMLKKDDGFPFGRGVPFAWDLDKLLTEGKLP